MDTEIKAELRRVAGELINELQRVQEMLSDAPLKSTSWWKAEQIVTRVKHRLGAGRFVAMGNTFPKIKAQSD